MRRCRRCLVAGFVEWRGCHHRTRAHSVRRVVRPRHHHHSAQAVALSNQTIGKQGVPTEIRNTARRISASSTTHVNELQALLPDWGFPHDRRVPSSGGRTSVAVGPGEHPLAVDADIRRLTNATRVGAAGVHLELMIRQHRFTISVARDERQSGSNPGAIAIARSLIESQPFKIPVVAPG